MDLSDKTIIAIIPARGGSARIPRKNLLQVGGRPLIAHTILHAHNSKHVSDIYVSTEDTEIAEVTRKFGGVPIERPLELSSDSATSESSLLHVLDHRKSEGFEDPDLVVFLQCTSAIRKLDDIDNAIETLIREGADTLFAACHFNKLIWEKVSGELKAVNWDYHHRKREQIMPPQYRENGSIYVIKPEILRKNNNRLGGRISVYEMDEWCSFQIDLPWEVELIEWILQRPEYSLSKDSETI